ncbi:MAG: hypothetical protein K9N06_06850, partial [Candidatus Cloacimonetes bacterium]|nr:hypothetical protein [Candidatus Cloacimonadota bacterium]
NDINLLTYLKYNSLQNNRAQIFLTWDRLLLTYTSRYCHYDYAHITTPPTLNDFLQIHEPLSEKELLSLVYRISKTAWKIPKQMHLSLDTLLSEFRVDVPNWHYLSELDNIHKNRARVLTKNTSDHFVDPFGYNDADEPII